MRVFNVRLAAILFAAFVVFGVGVYFLHAFQVRRNAVFFLEEARRSQAKAVQAAKDKDNDAETRATSDAMNFMSWYVRLMPKDYKAFEEYALMLADAACEEGVPQDRRMYFQAYQTLQNTVRLDPSRADARRRLAKMSMQIGRFQDAKQHIQGFLLKASPDDPELLEQLGECQAETGELKAAQESLQKAIAVKTTAVTAAQFTAYQQLASLLRFRLQQPEQADELMEKMVKANPKAYKAHLLRGQYLAHPAVNKTDAAIEEALEALSLAPDDTDVLSLAIMCYVAKGDFGKARECAVRGIKLYPSKVPMYKLLADVEMRAGDRNKALAAYEQGIKATKRDSWLLWNLASVLVESNKIDESQAILDELRKTTYSKQHIDLLTARIEFARGNWRAALERFEYVRGAMVALPGAVKQIDFWIAQCYERLGNPGQQEQALRRALAIDPSFGPARAAMSRLLAQRGQINEALGMAPVSQGTPAGLLQTARVAFLKTLQVPPAKRNWQPFEKAFAEAEKAAPESIEVAMLRADMLNAQERSADAEKALLKIHDKDPKNVAVWNALVAMADRQKDQKKAEKYLSESRAALGDCVAQRILQKEYLVRHRDKDTVQRLRQFAENTDKFSEMECLQLWASLLQSALQLNDGQQADLLGKRIAEKQPNNVQVRYLILERALSAQDKDAIEKALADVRRVAGEGAYWFYGLAMLQYLQAKDSSDSAVVLQQALDNIAKAREYREDWSRLPLAEAAIYDRLGKTDSAIQSYREAVSLGERNPNLIRRMVQIYIQSKQYSDADQLLRKIEDEQKVLPPELLRAMTEIALQQGELDRAIKKIRGAVSPNSKDSRDQLWLGQMLGIIAMQAKSQEQGKFDETLIKSLTVDAESALRAAVKLDPKTPVVWLSLVRFLAMIGEEGKAEAVVTDAANNLQEKDVDLTLAQCYEIIKKIDDAQLRYESALKTSPHDVAVIRTIADFYRRNGKVSLAEAELQKILDEKIPSKETDIVWARQQLARILAARRDYKSQQKALSLIENNLASPGVTAEDRRMYARLKAVNPAKGQRDNAIAVLKSLVDDKSAGPEDVMELVKMYLGDDNWPEASKLLRDLVAVNDKEPRYLALYIEQLLKHNELSSAEMYFDQLQKLSPNWFPTVSLNADLLCGNKQANKAFELLKGFVDRSDALPRDRATRLRLVGEKIDRLGVELSKTDQAAVGARCSAYAESVYRSYVKENPGRELVLAVFLGTRGKVGEALDILEKSMDSARATDFSQACSLIIESGKVNRAQANRMDQILQKALKHFKESVSISLVIAELRTYQTEYAEAIKMYSQILEKAPDSVMALNNLAVLQSLQNIKLEECLKLVNRAVEIAGPNGAILDSRATVYIAMNNPQKALEDIKDSVADQETPPRLFHLAQAYDLAGDKKSARKAFDRALASGLTKEMLQPLEFPTYKKLSDLPR